MTEPEYPPELLYDQRVIVIRGKQKFIGPVVTDILGVLWERRNRWVSSEHILRQVWGATPPESGTGALRSNMYNLRRCLVGTKYKIQSRANPGNGMYRLLDGKTR